MHAVAVAIFSVWGAFWIYWLAAAFGTKRGHLHLGRFAGFRVAIVVVVIALARAHVLKGATVVDDPWLEGIGSALFVSGLAVAIWARRYLGRNWGSPMSEKVDPELVTSGPYRSIRHPIYSGIILAMLGTAVAVSWYWLIVVGLMGGYFVYSATVEERYMTGRFPDAYSDYKRSTKMLIPFVF